MNGLWKISIFLVVVALAGCDWSSSSSSGGDPSLSEQAGGILMVGFRGQHVDEAQAIVDDIRIGRIGGIILFDRDVALSGPRNIESPEQLAQLVEDLQQISGHRLLVAIDQEGGAVNRLKPTYGFPETRRAQFFGDLDDTNETRDEAVQTASLLRSLGINVNLAPVVDLNIDPSSPAIGRWGRSYSADTDVVVRHAHTVISAHHEQGVATAIKHFPGHGSASEDSHLGFTDVTNTWLREELEPYRQLLAMNPPPDMVMTAHIFHGGLDSRYPATLSQAIIGNLLRGELGYQGLVISDDMQMRAITDYYGLEQAIELSLNAGVDLLIFANNLVYQPNIAADAQSIIVRLVEDGRVSADRLREAWRRVCDLKADLGLNC